MTTRKEKKTINISKNGLSIYDQLFKALESPIHTYNKLNYFRKKKKIKTMICNTLNILYLLKLNTLQEVRFYNL